VGGGFGQLCHGRRAPLAGMRAGDWIVYYSPASRMGGGDPVQAFTAIGRVGEEMWEAEGMHRRGIGFIDALEAPIRPMLPALSFVADPRRWGYPFRRGHFEVSMGDMRIIASAMGVDIETE
jgi:hypothetical protein